MFMFFNAFNVLMFTKVLGFKVHIVARSRPYTGRQNTTKKYTKIIPYRGRP